MNIPEKVYLRAHHLRTFINLYPFYNINWVYALDMYETYYNEDAQKGITDFYRSLARNPNAEIEVAQKVVGNPDSVCVLCNNYDRERNKCRDETISPLVDGKDRLSLFELGLKIGDVLTVREVVERFALNKT